MNANDPRHPWCRLTAAARQSATEQRDATAPYGFSTRIAALALSQERKVISLFDVFALRAVGVACLLALGSVALNYPAIEGGFANGVIEDDAISADDGMAIVMDLAGQ